jgi:subtilisin family serine protease
MHLRRTPGRAGAISMGRTARHFSTLLIVLMCCPAFAAAGADSPPRIVALARCGDLLDAERFTFCGRLANAPGKTSLRATLDEVPVPLTSAVERRFEFSLPNDERGSGELRLWRGEQVSNPVWLSLQDSAIVAATADEVVKNADGITTYVDLLGVVIEEQYDALPEARRLAKKYGARVVGAIPPLRLYQLRLDERDLLLRDAVAFRLGGEESVDAVVVEESSAEDADRATAKKRRHADTELAANRFADAVDYYRRRVPGPEAQRIDPALVRIGMIEARVDFDAPDFSRFLAADAAAGARLFARDDDQPDGHGSVVAGLLLASWSDGGNSGLLSGFGPGHGRFDVIVDRGSDAGITENVAASVRLVQDGARVLNWSWGLHRLGALRSGGGDVDSSIRSGVAFEGYEELLEEFFLWLRREHPDVIVVNSAGNGSSYSGDDDYRLPSSFVTEQLIVVGAHQTSGKPVAVADPSFVERRASSNIDARIDITAAACVDASVAVAGAEGEEHCGTSYATALVSGLVGAILSINPKLQPAQVRELLRRSSLPIGGALDFEPTEAEGLTAPILPSERAEQMLHPDIGRSARLDMRKALELAVESRTTLE